MTTLAGSYALARFEIRNWRLHLPALLGGALVAGALVEPLQFALLPAGGLEICYAGLFGIYLASVALGRRFTRFELFSLIIIVIVLAQGVILTGRVLIAALGGLWLLKPILVFLAGVLLADSRTHDTVNSVALAVCLAVSCTVILETLGTAWMNTSKGLSGLYGGAAQAGHAGVLGLLLLQSRTPKHRAAWWLLAALLLTSVLLTQSRHSLLLATIAILPWAGIRRIIRKRWLPKFLLVVVMLSLGVVTVGQRTLDRFEEIEEIAAGREYYRLYALRVGLRAGGENLGFGVGPGHFGGPVAHRFSADAEYQVELARFWVWRNAFGRPTTTDVAAAHVVGELGYVGFLLLLSWGAWLALRYRDPTHRQAISGPRSLVVVAVASALTFAPITNGPLQLVFFMLGTSRRAG